MPEFKTLEQGAATSVFAGVSPKLDGVGGHYLDNADFGTPEFSAWWHDPEFDPNQAAFYYARVLQVPTCRWSTYDAHRLGVEPTPFVPPSIQERAITSAIWYTPK